MRAMLRMVVNQVKGEMPSVTLVAFPPQGGELVALTESCASAQLLEAQVEELYQALKALLLEARAVFAASTPQESASVLPEKPEELWELMESTADLEQMRRIFNGLEERRRRELADYILGHANVFKGAGALFAQNYEEDRGVLA
jgi:hypothetical protein